MEMVYRLLAGVEQKEWLPKGKQYVIMKDGPHGHPTLLKPENTKDVTLNVMERAMDHLSSRLTGADTKWWSSFIASEREKRVTWEDMKWDKYMEGKESFDISRFHFKPLSSDQGDEDEADVKDRDNDFKTD